MPNVGPFELIIILVVVLLLFGSTRLPKLAKSLGEASKEFKKGVADPDEPPAAAAAAAPVIPAPTAPAAPPPVAPPASAAEEKVTLTRAELDALLAAREAQARRAEPGRDEPPVG